MNSTSRWRGRTLAGLLAGLVCGACSSTTTDGGGPVSIDVTADVSSVTTGTTVNVNYEAVGTYLTGVIIDYGDGLLDSIPAYGAQSAHGRLNHAWETAGQYQIVGTVYDASQGNATDQVSVNVTGSGGL